MIDLDTKFSQLPYVDLRPAQLPEQSSLAEPIDSSAAQLMPERVARRHGMIPFAWTHGTLHVALSHSLTVEARRELARLGRPIRLWRTHPTQFRTSLDRIWHREQHSADLDPLPVTRRRPFPVRLGDLLTVAGLVSHEDLDEALRRQAATGERIGSILANSNRVTPLGVAAAVARQHQLPLLDLLTEDRGRQGLEMLDPDLFQLMPAEFWRDYQLIPVGLDGNRLTVAMTDPGDVEALALLRQATRHSIRVTVTGSRDIVAAVEHLYGRQFLVQSRFGPGLTEPEASAFLTVSANQHHWGVVIGFLLGIGFMLRSLSTVVLVGAILQASYLALALFKLALTAQRAPEDHHLTISGDELENLDWSQLPVYTILVPAYHEAHMLPALIRALRELKYPADRLDVKLLLEEDDAETISVAKRLSLPAFIDMITVPQSLPRTKPKACNYGLKFARGEYVVTLSTDDMPEPDQLLKTHLAFRKARPHIACIHTKPASLNHDLTLLTRWSATEHVMWHDLLLSALRWPVSPSRTSNHFRTSVLRNVGGWDPFNVIPDADVGMRLLRTGYSGAVLDTITSTGGNLQLGTWMRQHSRWLKGSLQTWLVHMRTPRHLWRTLGTRGFIAFEVAFGGTPLMLLLNPVFILISMVGALGHGGYLPSLFPGWVPGLAAMNLIIGTGVFTYANMLAATRRKCWSCVGWASLAPIFWMLMSIAAWRALFQLIKKPWYWERTEHGLTTPPPPTGQAIR